jgi:hypothetical protein
MSTSERVLVDGIDCSNSAAGIIQALSSGRRWFVFTEPVCTFEQPIDLTPFGGSHDLRFEGGGPGVTRIVRGFHGGPILSYPHRNNGWRLSFTGLEFDGNKQQYPGAAPICEFGQIYLSYFENCVWRNGAGDGVRFIPDAQAPIFINCYFDANNGHGFVSDQANESTFIGGGARNNGGDGLHLLGSGGQIVTGNFNMQGMDLSGNAGRGIYLQHAHPATIRNCLISGNKVELGSDTRLVLVENNVFLSGAMIEDNGSENQVFSNYGPPVAPSNLNGEPFGTDSVELYWSYNSDNADGFRIYRDGVLVATKGSNITDHIDRRLPSGRTYAYYVTAYNNLGESAPSNTVYYSTYLTPAGG